MGKRTRYVVALVVAMGLGSVPVLGRPAPPRPGQTAPRQRPMFEGTLDRLEALEDSLRADLDTIAARAHNQRREDRRRVGAPSPKNAEAFTREWEETGPILERVHRAVVDGLADWVRELGTALAVTGRSVLPSAAEDRARIAEQALQVLTEAIRLDAPDRLLADLAPPGGPVALALRWHTGAQTRQRFLAAAGERLVSYPGRSDVDVLTHVLAWEAHFLARVPIGKPLLDVLSRDLMNVFTERGPDAFSLAEASFYRPSRYRDFGFAAAFRDDSDQVRHFCWALRLFHMAEDIGGMDAVEDLMVWKERFDSRLKGEPMNEADLELNQTIRLLTHAFLGTAEGASAPLAAKEYADRVRRALTDPVAARTSR